MMVIKQFGRVGVVKSPRAFKVHPTKNSKQRAAASAQRKKPMKQLARGRYIVGKGDYRVLDFFRSLVPKGLARKAGESLGSSLGAATALPGAATLGSALGGRLGDAFAKVTGFGDYHVSRNTLVTATGTPTFVKTAHGIRIQHKELCGTINGSVGFKFIRSPINPGNPLLFPWLSQLASSFEQYDMKGLLFSFESTSGQINATSAALGSIMMATQYDVQDPAFGSKEEMMSYEFSTSVVPCNSRMHPVECDPQRRQVRILKLRNGPPPSGSTRQLYDIGNFTIASQGQSSAYALGDLYVTYDIELLMQKLNPCADALWFVGGNAEADNATAASRVGSTAFYDQASTLAHAIGIDSSSNMFNCRPCVILPPNTLEFSVKGKYRVFCQWTDASGVTADPSFTPGSNIVISDEIETFVSTGATASFTIDVLASVDNTSNHITIGGLTGMASGDFRVTVQCIGPSYHTSPNGWLTTVPDF